MPRAICRATLEHSAGTSLPGAGGRQLLVRLQVDDAGQHSGSTGHGTLGWTMACGSANDIADIISGNKPAIETADLAISRN